MTDLETNLRAMLRERANDITGLSTSLLETSDEIDLDAPARHPHRRTGLSLSAAAACVLLVLGVASVLDRHGVGQRRDNRVGRSEGPRPSPTATTGRLPTALPPTAHALRQVTPTSIAVRTLPGFVIHARGSEPGYRWVAVRARADRGLPVGCNGCESATAYVDVFDRGRFDPAAHGVSSWTRTQVRGHAAYLGQLTWLGGAPHQVATLAWRFGTDRWALVQGVTAYGATTAVLAAIAAAVEPGVAAPVEVPFRLTWIPDLPLTKLIDDRSEGYALTISLGHNDGTRYRDPQLDITLWPRDPRSVAHTTSHRVMIDGVVGWYDRAQGVADIPVSGQTLEIGITDTGSLSAGDRIMLDRVLAGLRVGASSTRVPAQEAIP